ncbi:unnamed protein product [Oppiella nova]|uniref:Protein kinase domain-containing protein n=1 Tax=Oppiella nova TaxID=334625 RepID=A0A7R9LLP9_9ACAR|nr:unnamed protein product [Oppiella nova]CAG2164229.1 unnamed protein product [Oppiella nova]
MSSPSPTCMTPTGGLCSGNGQHSPSTLSSIREAVSHLTRLDDFNVIKLSHGFFSQVFKYDLKSSIVYYQWFGINYKVTHHSTKKVMVLKMNKQAGNRAYILQSNLRETIMIGSETSYTPNYFQLYGNKPWVRGIGNTAALFIRYNKLNKYLTKCLRYRNALKEIELLNKLNHENIVAFMGTVVHEVPERFTSIT